MSHIPSSREPNLTPGTKAFVSKVQAAGGPPLYTLSPPEARQVLIDTQSGGAPGPEADVCSLELPVGPGGSVDVRITRPYPLEEKRPIVLYLHGGGWVMGNTDTHDRLVRELAVGSGAAVVFVDYVPSPDAQYPDPYEQAWAALEYISENADKHNLDGSRLALAGDSVGGNMAIVLALLAKKQRKPKIRLQLLFYPVTDANFDTGSYQAFADGPWLTRKAMEWFWDNYLPDQEKRADITASPLGASLEQLQGLPPAIIFTAENDVLRDEGEAFFVKLCQAGVEAAALRCLGTIHDFVLLNGLAATGPARTALNCATTTLRKYLK